MTHPAIGVFVKPVAAHPWYCYCLEIMAVVSYEACSGEMVQWQCRRWAMKDGQPCEDGSPHNMNYLNGLQYAAPGVWRDPYFDDGLDPIYYRKIETKGQQDFFK